MMLKNKAALATAAIAVVGMTVIGASANTPVIPVKAIGWYAEQVQVTSATNENVDGTCPDVSLPYTPPAYTTFSRQVLFPGTAKAGYIIGRTKGIDDGGPSMWRATLTSPAKTFTQGSASWGTSESPIAMTYYYNDQAGTSKTANGGGSFTFYSTFRDIGPYTELGTSTMTITTDNKNPNNVGCVEVLDYQDLCTGSK